MIIDLESGQYKIEIIISTVHKAIMDIRTLRLRKKKKN